MYTLQELPPVAFAAHQNSLPGARFGGAQAICKKPFSFFAEERLFPDAACFRQNAYSSGRISPPKAMPISLSIP